MSETIEAPARPAHANYIGGEWVPSAGGGDLREAQSRAPVRGRRRRSRRSTAEDVDRAVEAAAAELPGLVGHAGRRARRRS